MAELFDRAPEEVIRYFDSKGEKVSFDWRDVAPEEHAYAFTVAKTAGHDVLVDIRSAVSDAIASGENFETFRNRIEPILRDKGWWGRGVAYDDVKQRWTTGQLGSVRRLRTIYWANMSTAKAAGEWDRIQRTKDYLPFLVYMRSTAEKKRLLHAAWAAQPVVLPADHAWWTTHYPPNGWLCKCGVRQITRAEAIRLGWTPELEAPVINMVKWVDKRNGREVWVPEGIDPGWQTNAGLNRRANVANYLGDRLAQLPPAARQVALTDIMADKLFQDVMARRGVVKMNVPVAPVGGAARQITSTAAAHIWLSADSAWHIFDEHASRGLTTAHLAAALMVINDVNIQPAKLGEKRATNSIVYLGDAAGVLWRVTVKYLNDEAYVTSVVPKSDINRFEK